jgi:hypothetical protein
MRKHVSSPLISENRILPKRILNQSTGKRHTDACIMDGWMHEWMDGAMDRGMDGAMEGRID